MKKILTTIILLSLITPATALADDFWAVFSETFAYKHAVSGNYIPAMPAPERVPEDTTRNLALKSFGVAFGTRFSQIASDQKDELIRTCLFAREPYRCAFESIMTATVDETGFMPKIRFSDRFIKKAWKLYDRTLRNNETIDERMKRARRVPPWKKFNPRINFQFDSPELIAALPFYTFFSIYVEPSWGARSGPRLVLIRQSVSLDIGRDGMGIQFRLLRNPVGKGYYSVNISPDRSIALDTFLLIY
ncbi:MAG: hypothetical protein ABIH66_10335 [bacterium]